MNAVTIVIGSICILMIAYRLYGIFFTKKVLKLDDSIPTPAHVVNDGKDYVPTNKWVTFGHHFAAIAAAGPLVGPILAAQFGYLPSLLWLGCFGSCASLSFARSSFVDLGAAPVDFERSRPSASC